MAQFACGQRDGLVAAVGLAPATGRRIAVAVAVSNIAHWSARRSTLLAIEEPKNGLHPHLSKHLVDLLRTASETRQVLVTTHNPDFIDELEPEEVILCDKKDGFTMIRQASEINEIKSFRKSFRLGELWEESHDHRRRGRRTL